MDVDHAQPTKFAQADSHTPDSNSGRGICSIFTWLYNVLARCLPDRERGPSKHNKKNSLYFGQELEEAAEAFEDASDHFSFDGLEEGSEVDLEAAGQERAQAPILQAGDAVGLQKQPDRKTRASSTGSKSRLKTLILDQSWISVYKRLYLITNVLNITALLLAGSGHFPYAKSNAILFSLGNIVMCVLVRNEVFLRVVYWVAVHVLGHRWVPLRLKTMTTALLQSLGGIHSGCGLGAVMWLAYGLVLTFQNLQNASKAMVAVAAGILSLLVLSACAAFPVVRHIHHNIFERVHRFAGWSSLGLVWLYVVLDSFWVPAKKSYNISSRSLQELVEMEALWLTVAATIMLILPWLSVRRVAVEAVVPPAKLNTLLKFKGGVKPGLLARVSSPGPFSEWHAFGIISDGRETHTLVVGKVGDFTTSLVERPPTHVWIRTLYFAGLPYLTNLYQRVLQVATGSGIGVNMSFVLQQTRTDVHLIWIAKSIRESFGDEIWQAVNDVPPDRITVIDTAVSGRPKIVDLVLAKAIEWKADIVTVTSNPFGTAQIVNGCKAIGIPAFGPIWDS